MISEMSRSLAEKDNEDVAGPTHSKRRTHLKLMNLVLVASPQFVGVPTPEAAGLYESTAVINPVIHPIATLCYFGNAPLR